MKEAKAKRQWCELYSETISAYNKHPFHEKRVLFLKVVFLESPLGENVSVIKCMAFKYNCHILQ